MMKSHLITPLFITCFFCCSFVTSSPVPPRPDQVEILLAFKNEFPSPNCELMWDNGDGMVHYLSMNSWTKDNDASSYDGVRFDNKTGVVTDLFLLAACINGIIQANSSLFKLQHLRYLDLSRNHFKSSPIPAEFGRLTNLESLDLSQSGFIGEVPSSISNLSRLTTLTLSYNNLTGRFPPIHKLTKLSYIDLSNNHFSGTIPSSLFTMPSLSHLNLRQNHLRDPPENMSSSATSKLGCIDMAENLFSFRILEPLSKFPNITYPDLSFQNTTNTINSDSLPFKALQQLDLSGNNLTEFPMFIKTLRNLQLLYISKNGLKGKVPEWVWGLPSLQYMNLSQNSFNTLEGSPKVLLNSSLSELDLSANAFQGSFPIIPPTIRYMAASNNHFTGGISLSLCNATNLTLLDLSNNIFNGSIPRCLGTLLSLEALKLKRNNITGGLPDMSLRKLTILDVGHNQISGKLPRSLLHSTDLTTLDVESNRITDTFPFWLKALENLEVIILRSNRFHGPLSSPQHPLSFPTLRVIDISDNHFSGTLPLNYFQNWSLPMVNITRVGSVWYIGERRKFLPNPQWYFIPINLRNKGLNREFEKILNIFTAIDFSGNRLEGQIPESIGLLKSLIALDLSNNSFTGHIPSSLAKLAQLESLDLSQNQISGKIPQELATVTFLSYVNMSHNKLSGQIPQSTQIGGQPKSCFQGNIDLCGLPLEESCFKGNGAPSTPETQEAEQEQVLNWKAAVIGYGPGVLFGVAIAQALAIYKPVLFFKLFRL